MTYLNYDAGGFIVGVNKMSDGIDRVHDDTQEIIQILKSQNQIANTRMTELTRAVRKSTYQASSQSSVNSNRERAASGRTSSSSRITGEPASITRRAPNASQRTQSNSNTQNIGNQARAARRNQRGDQAGGDTVPISRDSANASSRTRSPNRDTRASTDAAGRERDARGRFTGGSSSASENERKKLGFGSLSGGRSDTSGIDPLFDSFREAKDLLSPISGIGKLAGRGVKFSVSKLKAMKRREPLPNDQSRHNNENEKLLDKILKAIRKQRGNGGGGGLLGGLLGGGGRGRGGGLKNLFKKMGGLKMLGVLSAVAGTAGLAMDWDSLDHQGKSEGVGRLAGAGAGAVIGATVGSVVPVVGTAVGAVVGGWLGSEGGEWLGGVASPYIESWTSAITAYNLPAKMSDTWNEGIKPFFTTMAGAARNFYENSLSTVSAAIDNVGNFIDGGMDGITSTNAGANGATAANLSEKQNKNQMMVYESFRNAGLSDGQARAMTAEVGRENGYQDKYLFGGHSDPANNEYNLGMFSWQKERGKKLYKHLNSKGMVKNGKIIQSQEALNEQAKFAVNEINTDPSYSRTKKEFLNKPNVSYGKANEVLGRNYIRWRYDDPKYAEHHQYRDQYKAAIDKQLKPIEDTTIIDEAKAKTGKIAQNVKDAVTQKQQASKEVKGSLANKAKNNSSALGVEVGKMTPNRGGAGDVKSNFSDNTPMIFNSSTPAGKDLGYAPAHFPSTPMLSVPNMPKIKQRLDSGGNSKPIMIQSSNDSINQNVSDRSLAHAITGGLGQQRQWG
ncbi:hypothetical protein Q6344_06680 [Psychrobacter cibarius]|nr:hypothetical protein Q6344_06680 [Psychrobacter cibarius]